MSCFKQKSNVMLILYKDTAQRLITFVSCVISQCIEEGGILDIFKKEIQTYKNAKS